MLKVQRLAIVWSATIFFLVVSPVLAIYALGYDFDLKINDLKNTVTTSVETAPDNARINIYSDFGSQSNIGNTDFRISTNNQFKLTISKDGFIGEDFRLKGKAFDNSLIRLKKINLLPILEQKTASVPKNWQNISFVGKEFILFSKNEIATNQNLWYLQQYSYGGFLGEPKLVSSFVSDNQVAITQTLPINLDTSLAPNIENITVNSYWEALNSDTFWQRDTQTYLFKDTFGNWKIWQAQFLDMGQIDTLWISQDTLLLHDRISSKNLYNFDIKSGKLTYLTDNIKAISLNNNQLWLWYGDALYKFNKDELGKISNYDWSGVIKYQISTFEAINTDLLYQDLQDLQVKNVYQGTVVSINGQIFYLSDSEIDKWVLIASNVKYWTVAWHSIFWISTDGHLITQNLELKYRRVIDQLKFDVDQKKVVKIEYYADWHRVFVYISDKDNINSNLETYSLWYNPDFINDEIKTFSQKKWLEQMVCRPLVENGYIFCINPQNNFVYFRNNN